MNRAYHYNTTLGVLVEAEEHKGNLTYDVMCDCIIMARSNEMVDRAIPGRLPLALYDRIGRLVCPTQADIGAGSRLLYGDNIWPLMVRVHHWHFNPMTGWEWIDCHPESLLCPYTFGAHLHPAQDTEIGGPHEYYVGFPHEANLKRAKAVRAARGESESGVSRVLKFFRQEDESWGHMADKEADNIENCRDGAYRAGHKLYTMISGKKTVVVTDSIGGIAYPTVLNEDGVRVESLTAILRAHSDRDLELRQNRVFLQYTKEIMPEFRMFEGLELAKWGEVTA